MNADEPLTALGEAAAAMHELYESLTTGGFTEDEALTVIAKMINEAGLRAEV